jgi:hypothetical protein
MRRKFRAKIYTISCGELGAEEIFIGDSIAKLYNGFIECLLILCKQMNSLKLNTTTLRYGYLKNINFINLNKVDQI